MIDHAALDAPLAAHRDEVAANLDSLRARKNDLILLLGKPSREWTPDDEQLARVALQVAVAIVIESH
jgi:hypothetical protein